MTYKRLLSLLLCLLLAVSLFGQKKITPYYGQMLYWKSLDVEQKKTFLFAYLSCSYEIVQQMRDEGVRGLTLKEFRRQYTRDVELVFQLITQDSTAEERIIEWVDTFYDFELYRERPFREALKWAYDKYFAEKELRK